LLAIQAHQDLLWFA